MNAATRREEMQRAIAARLFLEMARRTDDIVDAAKVFITHAAAAASKDLATREDLTPGELDALASRLTSACLATILIPERIPSKGALRDAATAAATNAATSVTPGA